MRLRITPTIYLPDLSAQNNIQYMYIQVWHTGLNHVSVTQIILGLFPPTYCESNFILFVKDQTFKYIEDNKDVSKYFMLVSKTALNKKLLRNDIKKCITMTFR